ncbi:hypothetical protein ACSVDE_08375 [Pseudalkalibacillus sp. Hm43]|uniref:hypothetical protein n=1 Tax=Pseudalkalibacillus sp. Hm43 TaxID=3450742 RepID=UPI003F41F7CF
MIIHSISGEELEKSKSNSPEEFFTRSEVTFSGEDGKSKTLAVLYVRFFDEKMSEWSPFESDPIFDVKGKSIHMRDVVALIALHKNPDFQHRHRVYINEEEAFAALFKGLDAETITGWVTQLESDGQLNLETAQA